MHLRCLSPFSAFIPLVIFCFGGHVFTWFAVPRPPVPLPRVVFAAHELFVPSALIFFLVLATVFTVLVLSFSPPPCGFSRGGPSRLPVPLSPFLPLPARVSVFGSLPEFLLAFARCSRGFFFVPAPFRRVSFCLLLLDAAPFLPPLVVSLLVVFLRGLRFRAATFHVPVSLSLLLGLSFAHSLRFGLCLPHPSFFFMILSRFLARALQGLLLRFVPPLCPRALFLCLFFSSPHYPVSPLPSALLPGAPFGPRPPGCGAPCSSARILRSLRRLIFSSGSSHLALRRLFLCLPSSFLFTFLPSVVRFVLPSPSCSFASASVASSGSPLLVARSCSAHLLSPLPAPAEGFSLFPSLLPPFALTLCCAPTSLRLSGPCGLPPFPRSVPSCGCSCRAIGFSFSLC